MLLRETISVCPVCKNNIPASVVEEYGSIFLEKKCPEHGEFKVKVARHAWYYKGLEDFHNKLYPQQESSTRAPNSYVALIASRCNLDCPICLTNIHRTLNLPEMSLDFIAKELYKIKNHRKIIRLSGGEPTLREDLPQIIKLIAKSGNVPLLITNGLKLIDFEYVKILKKAGLKIILMSIESLSNEEVNKLIRGVELIDIKNKVLENIKKIGIYFEFYHVAVKNLNEKDTEECLDFVRRNKFIKALWIGDYSHSGKEGLSRDNEFILDELIEMVAKRSNNQFTLEDVFYWQKLNYIIFSLRHIPSCCSGQTIVLSRDKSKKANFTKFAKELDCFEKKLKYDLKSAVFYYYTIIIPKLMLSTPFFLHSIIWKIITLKGVHSYLPILPSEYFLLKMSSFYDAWNYDKAKIYNECSVSILHLGVENRFPRCALAPKIFSSS